MYHTLEFIYRLECPAIDYVHESLCGSILIHEDIRDAIPFLYEEHFHERYNELGWYLIEGAREFVKDLEDKWSRNELDLSPLYDTNEDFQEYLKERYFITDQSEVELDIEMLKDDCEDTIEQELDLLDDEERRELLQYDEKVYYDVYIEDKLVTQGSVSIPEPEDEDDEEDYD